LPVETDQSFSVLSADPETMNFDCARENKIVVKDRNDIDARCGLTVYVDRPDSTIVTVICTQTFAIMREPNIYDVVLGA
jgi:hypothetical protein